MYLKKKRNLMGLMIIVVIIVIVILIYLYRGTKPQANLIKTPIVTVAPLTYHVTEQTVTAYGTTISPTSMVIRAQDSAEVAAIHFKPGQKVKKGQLLFHLKVSDISSQQQKLKAQMLQSKSFYLRLLRMNQKVSGIVSSFDLLKAKTQYKRDLATYKQVNVLENIRAPINGVVSDTDYSVGDIVAAGGKLTRITDPNFLQVKYQLPSQYVKQTHLGQVVRFHPDGADKVYIGTVSYVSPQFDSNSYGLTIRANLNNFSGLRPNHFGRVIQVINARYKTLAIPQGLVHSDAQGFYIYVLNKNKVDKHYFKAGEVNKEGLIQVLSGIKANTPIINSDQTVISPNQSVRVSY